MRKDGRKKDHAYLVLLNDLPEGNDLGVGEAIERINVVAATEQLTFVFCEAALSLEEGARRRVLRAFDDPFLYATREVICMKLIVSVGPGK